MPSDQGVADELARACWPAETCPATWRYLGELERLREQLAASHAE
jgi:hypothetical protein